jgi:hypothetical protein
MRSDQNEYFGIHGAGDQILAVLTESLTAILAYIPFDIYDGE